MGGMGGMGMQPGMGQGGLGEGTQATFQLIESIIGAVGGFAQMLEATYMATIVVTLNNQQHILDV